MLEEHLEEERFFRPGAPHLLGRPGQVADSRLVRVSDREAGLLTRREEAGGRREETGTQGNALLGPRPLGISYLLSPNSCCGVMMDYKSSGVDIDAGNETVRRIKEPRALLKPKRASNCREPSLRGSISASIRCRSSRRKAQSSTSATASPAMPRPQRSDAVHSRFRRGDGVDRCGTRCRCRSRRRRRAW